MKKQEIELLVNKGMTTREIGKYFNMSQTGAVHWLKKFNLTVEGAKSTTIMENGLLKKICSVCQEKKPINSSNFFIRKNGRCYSICRTCKSRQQRDYKSELKKKCIEYKGGECQICHYKRCIQALEFHHLDPNQKDFEIARLLEHKFEFIKHELDKCICICSNCHREIHYGIIIP